MNAETAPTIDTVVVPLDESRFSERAVYVAAQWAKRTDVPILLLSAVAKEAEVDHRRARLLAARPRRLEVECDVIIDPDPADAIDIVMRDLPNAVVCMASHGRGRTAALVGSIATEVVRRRPEPVVLVGPAFEEERWGTGIVACLDEHEASAAIIPAVLEFSAWLSEPVTVITVAEPVPPPITAGPLRRRFGPDDDVEQFLERMVAPYRAKGYELATEAVYDPVSPVSGVRDYLRDHPAALVAAGTRARTGLARAVFGSTTASIVHQSTAPVLMVRRPDADVAT